MEFTNILGKIKTSDKKEKETFFALEICSDTVKSAVWEVVEGKTEVIKIGTVEEWDEKKEDSFLSAVDRTISSASAGITPEPNSIIFGLPEDWADKDKINKSKKKILKEVCEKLELKPLGFVVTIEALVTFLRKKQGTPPSAIFIRLAETEIYVKVVSLGKVLKMENVVRSEDLAADVKEGLVRFGQVENFPPRMILFDSDADFEEAKQQLISYEWDKELPFLHFPKVESLAVETSIRAVAVAGGSEVAKSLGLEIKEEEERGKVAQAEKVEKEKVSEASEESEKKKDEKDVAEELGFVAGADVLKEKVAPVVTGMEKAEKVNKAEKVEKKEKKEEKKSAFTKAPPGKEEIKISEGGKEPRFEPKFSQEIPTEKQKVIPRKRLAWVSNLFAPLKGLKSKIFTGGLSFSRLKSLKFPLSGFPAILTFVIFIFVGLFIGGFFIYWRLPKAKITIFVKPEVLEKEVSLTVSSDQTSFDEENQIIPGEMQTIEVDGKETIDTTGKKLIGDEASGEVTVFNKTDSAKKFEAGTVLVGPDSLRFELTGDVEVASKSSETTIDGEKIIYGKATTNIEAASIGPEYNVGGETEFSFKDFGSGSFSAKTENGLSGGTSREIKAVSEDDTEALLEKLTQKLEVQAAGELEEKLPSGMRVFEKGMESEIKGKNFNHDVGDEADKLSLDLSLKISALSFAKQDLDALLLNVLSGMVPTNFQLRPTDLTTEIKETEIDETEANFDVLVKAQILPKYDIEKLIDGLVGKYPEIAQENLSSLPNFAKAIIEISPRLPGKLGTLPRLKQNIEIEVRIADNL